jgi:RimJ/RimL family protein N-acetyltransferase
VTNDDLPIFFEHQLDPVANRMAAFTSRDPADRNAFDAHWAKILHDPTVTMKTILLAGRVVGSVGKFELSGKPNITYWIGREYWGKGLATRALSMFLTQVKTRPLYASAAKDNVASIRVLEKCGFTFCRIEKSLANARAKRSKRSF